MRAKNQERKYEKENDQKRKSKQTNFSISRILWIRNVVFFMVKSGRADYKRSNRGRNDSDGVEWSEGVRGGIPSSSHSIKLKRNSAKMTKILMVRKVGNHSAAAGTYTLG